MNAVRGEGRAGWRGRPLALYAVLAVVAGLAALVYTATARAQNAAMAIHTTDRAQQQGMLADLTGQYLQYEFTDLARFANAHPWPTGHAGTAADTALLAELVSGPDSLVAAELTDLSGGPVAHTGTAVPAAGAAGYLPLIADLQRGQPGLSGVLQTTSGPLLAMAVPVTASGRPVGLLVAYSALREWPLEGYIHKLTFGPQADYQVLDSADEVVAASNPAQIGSVAHLPSRLGTRRADAITSAGAVYSAAPVGVDGWLATTSQPVPAFDQGLIGPFHSLFLALAGLLLVAAAGLTISENRRRRVLGKLADEAIKDPLTGVATRRLLETRLQNALPRNARSGKGVVVAFCDIDGFKLINDRHGHSAGDEVLVRTAARLRDCLREDDLVARLGGDEFVAVVEGLSGEDDLDALAQRILQACSAAVPYRSRLIAPAVSVGLAVLPPEGTSAAEAIHAADTAMYEAKRAGGNRFVIQRLAKPVPTPRREAGEVTPAG